MASFISVSGSAHAQEYGLDSEIEIREVEEEWIWLINIGNPDLASRPIFVKPHNRPESSNIFECTSQNTKGCYYAAKFMEAFFDQDGATKYYDQACRQGLNEACNHKKRLKKLNLSDHAESFAFYSAYREHTDEIIRTKDFSSDPYKDFYTPENYKKYKKSAQKGDPFASVIVGNIYLNTAHHQGIFGRKVKRGIKEKNVTKLVYKAAGYYKFACLRRVAIGCARLGSLYANGSYGHEVNYEKSMRLFRKSCYINARAGACDDIKFERQKADIIEERLVSYYNQGDFKSAIEAGEDLLKIAQAAYGPEDPVVAKTLFYLSNFHREQGNTDVAEKLNLQAYAIWESYGLEGNAAISLAYHNKALIEFGRQNFDATEDILLRAERIREKFVAQDTAFSAATLHNLGVTYFANGRLKTAKEHLLRALSILEKQPNQDPVLLAKTHTHLAAVYSDQNEFQKASQGFEKALKLMQNPAAANHPFLSNIYSFFGMNYFEQDLFPEARENLQLALSVAEASFSANHPQIIDARLSLGNFYLFSDPPNKLLALQHYDQVVKEITERLMLYNNKGVWLRHSTEQDRKRYSRAYSRHAVLSTFLAATNDDSRRLERVSGAFLTAQHALNSTTGKAIQQYTARLSSDKNSVSKTIRAFQDIEAEWLTALQEQSKAMGLNEGKSSEIEGIRKIEKIEAKLRDIDKELEKTFPEHAALTSPDPLTFEEVKLLLRDDEALIFTSTDIMGTIVFAISSTDVVFSYLNRNSENLSEAVRVLRQELQTPDSTFPLDYAYGIYQEVFGGVESVFKGKRHIMTVTSGPLESIPLGVLVIQAPADSTATLEDLQTTRWWGTEQAISALPSVSTLRALRTKPRKKSRKYLFSGFGDPKLGPNQIDDRDRSLRGIDAYYSGQLASVDALMSLGDLAGTKKELKAMANALGSKPSKSLWLGERNTETNIKSLDLSESDIIVFATHALMSGEISGYSEPGLVFTPPEIASRDDDGLLTTSEITHMKLNADWIILSACNTASAQKVGAEGLSGLARAFFYAGARSVLASHWYVSDDATAMLTTQTMLMKKADPSLSKAEALRLSMQSLIKDDANIQYAHPYYWAPFVLIGDID